MARGPERFIPGNSMTFPGIKDANARQDVIAYLKAVSENNSAPRKKADDDGSAPSARDLKKADADAQVASLTHCRDTYTVKTAKGSTHKIWEFNLRLKTDSSEYGPFGKPVITGSGMMGDRASIVFASPAEISSFIKETCN